jgi:hypothetical protein
MMFIMEKTIQAMRGDNAYAILSYVAKELRNRGMNAEAVKFIEEATAGDYGNLCDTAERYAECIDGIDHDAYAQDLHDHFYPPQQPTDY